MTVLFDINGVISTEEEARISPFDRGLLLGDGCFEVVLVKNGDLIFWDDHIERLFDGIEYLQIKGICRQDLYRRSLSLLEHLPCNRAYLRIMVNRGNGLGFANLEDFKPNIYIYLKQLPEETEQQKAVSLKACSLGYTDVTYGLKALNIKILLACS